MTRTEIERGTKKSEKIGFLRYKYFQKLFGIYFSHQFSILCIVNWIYFWMELILLLYWLYLRPSPSLITSHTLQNRPPNNQTPNSQYEEVLQVIFIYIFGNRTPDNHTPNFINTVIAPSHLILEIVPPDSHAPDSQT